MHIFQLKSNDMLYKIEPAWILLLEHIAGYSSDVETTLMVNADDTYLLIQSYNEK